jgi:plastocyanin
MVRGQATFAVENTGTLPHSLEIRGADGSWSSPPIPPAGGTVLMSLLIEPGEYELSCPDDAGAHKQQGMRGKITVY